MLYNKTMGKIDTDTLKGIGLTDNEVKVYLALFELGESLASKIGEKTGLNRTHAYDVIESLLAKGIVCYVVKENRKYFRPANPAKLRDYVQEKQDQLKEQEGRISQLIPSLMKLQLPKEEEGVVEVYKGKEGYKTLYSQLLNEAKEYCVIGASGYFPEKMEQFYEAHERTRIKKKIRLKILVNSKIKGKPMHKRVYTGRTYSQIRFLPETFDAPVPIIVYNDKVFMMIWPIMQMVLVKNKHVADMYRDYFNVLWKVSREKI